MIVSLLLPLSCVKKGFKDYGSSPAPSSDQGLDNSNPISDPTDKNETENGNETVVQVPPGNPPTNHTGTPLCEEPVVETGTEKPTRVLFIVDQSGSNLGDPPPGTDAYKIFRLKVIQDFYNRHYRKSFLSWGFISFGDSSAKAFVNAGMYTMPIFSQDSIAMANAIETFRTYSDSGSTPYKAALKMAGDLITADMATAPADTEYLLALMTDGEPSDYCVDGMLDCPGVENAIDNDLRSVVNLSPTKIKFGTVYYGQNNVAAINRLKRLATIGGGQFLDANKTSEIKLDTVINFPGHCP